MNDIVAGIDVGESNGMPHLKALRLRHSPLFFAIEGRGVKMKRPRASKSRYACARACIVAEVAA